MLSEETASASDSGLHGGSESASDLSVRPSNANTSDEAGNSRTSSIVFSEERTSSTAPTTETGADSVAEAQRCFTTCAVKDYDEVRVMQQIGSCAYRDV